MPNYLKLDTGESTESTDYQRGVWYGQCGYWTDDWDKLSKIPPGIPCCPTCSGVGFQCTAEQWLKGAKRFQGEGNPFYVKFLHVEKERCGVDAKELSFRKRYERWRKEQGL